MPDPRDDFSQEEIKSRGEIVRWMDLMGWEDSIQDSIMLHHNPDPATVRRLVYRHGPDEALRRIRLIVRK